MTRRHMEIFCAICQENYNITKAADRLHMTQPAVSLAIKELEKYYGIMLFDRIGRRLQITSAGERFLQYALKIITQFDDLEREMKNWDSMGILRVGSSITIASQLLPAYLKKFYCLFPDIEVQTTVAPSAQIEEKILNNELDIALIEGCVHNPLLYREQYLEDSLTVIASPNMGFHPGDSLTLEQFKNQTILLREKGSGTRESFDMIMKRNGTEIRPVWEGTSTMALMNAVINGLGISVLPYRMVKEALDEKKVISIHIKDIEFKRYFYIIFHRDKYLSKAAKAFLNICRHDQSYK